MIVLGFDTATPATAVGLLLEGRCAPDDCGAPDDPDAPHDRIALQVSEDAPPGGRPGHATRLLAIAAQLLDEAGLRWQEIGLVAVGLGPGSFTGLRIGVATARGLAQSLGVPLQGVGTLRALARAASDALGQDTLREDTPREDTLGEDTLGRPRVVLAVLDARRGEAFAAAYQGDRELIAPAALAPDDLARLAASLTAHGPVVAVGDGAVRFAEHLQGAGVDIPPGSSGLHSVSAITVCRLAAAAADHQAAGATGVLPDYRRRPDAEIGARTASKT